MPVLDSVLTAEQHAQFERDGFLLVSRLFTPAEVAEIRECFMAQNEDGPVPGLSEIRGGKDGYSPDDPLAFYPRMMHPHLHPELPVGPLSVHYMLHPRLYPILRGLFGDEPVAVQSMFYFKPAGARGQELHQDNYYLRVAPGTCMAAWVAVDDADPENGGLKVVPGSHRLEVICPQRADASLSFTSDYVPVPAGMQSVPCSMRAGDVLFFNGSLIHGSTPNSSQGRFRRSFICHYVPQSSSELSRGYQSRLTFDGNTVTGIGDAVGGGPCGTPQPTVPH
jgi:hypothetical protein